LSGTGRGNFAPSAKGGSVVVSLNRGIYPLPVVFSAAYAMMDQAYAAVDARGNRLFAVTLWPKGKRGLKALAMRFNEELVNSAVCFNQAKETAAVREALVKRVFLAHSAPGGSGSGLFVGDIKGIAKPWREQRGKRV